MVKTSRIKSSVFWLVPTAVLFISACSERPYFEQYLPVSKQGWHLDSAASFEVEIKDTTSTYAVLFNLRANDAYPYSNIYLFRSVFSDDGLEYQDTAQVILADAYGKWLGDGIGELKTFTRPFRAQPLRFNRRGTYTFKFVQGMRDTLLTGVEDVGLTIYKEENDE